MVWSKVFSDGISLKINYIFFIRQFPIFQVINLDIGLCIALNTRVIVYLYILLSGIFGFLLTYAFKRVAESFDILDNPRSRPDSKKHKTPIPLLGGLGFCVSAIILMVSLYFLEADVPWIMNNVEDISLLGIILGFIIIVTGGILDDILTYSSKTMFFWIVSGVAVTVWMGDLGIDALSYPFEQLIPNTPFIHNLLAFFWIIACIAATKFLDGLDGLVASVGVVSFLTIASIASFSFVDQPFIILLGLSLAIVLGVFLYWNFPNARLYLGESGSEAIGFWVGVLSIISGAKIATSLSVIGWFVIDIIFVFAIRFFQGNSIFKADRQHWHHRLVDNGISKEKALVLTTLIILISSHISLITPTVFKGLIILFQIAVIGFSVWYFNSKKIEKQPQD